MKYTNNLKKLVSGALMAAIVFVFTIVIKVPVAITNGYINIGDTAVLLCSYLVGGIYGALAAGIGSALADMSQGYVIYAPATFIIKFMMVFVANFFCNNVFKSKKSLSMAIAGIVSEIIMVLGYFIFESIFLGLGITALVGVYGNIIQGIICFILANVLGKVFVRQIKTQLIEST